MEFLGNYILKEEDYFFIRKLFLSIKIFDDKVSNDAYQNTQFRWFLINSKIIKEKDYNTINDENLKDLSEVFLKETILLRLHNLNAKFIEKLASYLKTKDFNLYANMGNNMIMGGEIYTALLENYSSRLEKGIYVPKTDLEKSIILENAEQLVENKKTYIETSMLSLLAYITKNHEHYGKEFKTLICNYINNKQSISNKNYSKYEKLLKIWSEIDFTDYYESYPKIKKILSLNTDGIQKDYDKDHIIYTLNMNNLSRNTGTGVNRIALNFNDATSIILNKIKKATSEKYTYTFKVGTLKVLKDSDNEKRIDNFFNFISLSPEPYYTREGLSIIWDKLSLDIKLNSDENTKESVIKRKIKI